jgi:hypothetical protein
MPNISRPSGARPVKHLSGAPWNGQTQLFAILASNGTATGVGDFVSLDGNADANGVPSVARITNGSTSVPVGAIVGFLPDYSNLYNPSQYRLASTLRYVFVVTDPTVVYEMQASGTYGFATDSGLNSGVTLTAVSTAGISGMQVDLATKATTATLPVKILGVIQRPDLDVSDATNVKLWVTLNNGAFNNGTTGV